MFECYPDKKIDHCSYHDYPDPHSRNSKTVHILSFVLRLLFILLSLFHAQKPPGRMGREGEAAVWLSIARERPLAKSLLDLSAPPDPTSEDANLLYSVPVQPSRTYPPSASLLQVLPPRPASEDFAS